MNYALTGKLDFLSISEIKKKSVHCSVVMTFFVANTNCLPVRTCTKAPCGLYEPRCEKTGPRPTFKVAECHIYLDSVYTR